MLSSKILLYGYIIIRKKRNTGLVRTKKHLQLIGKKLFPCTKNHFISNLNCIFRVITPTFLPLVLKIKF
jgi:hypothetical protein